ncbi:hypothetical protein Mal15_38170 [Stieleria maiorica]|uniref:Uncharacterized protein n=1 Tax=Stieleria maiorica TaxID=2795974 RepID=A0A5B9MEQ8_9BACT|nr:hypothetical protein [Stieleria maiorica]QEF99751.1 hypothetical protein Mal15_38170 [Stieleria maiorica]
MTERPAPYRITKPQTAGGSGAGFNQSAAMENREMESAIAKPERTYLGMFSVRTGVLVATDPCYDIGSCGGLMAVSRGVWSAMVDAGFDENTLTVCHESFKPSDADKWELMPFQVGVDTGRFGLFDAVTYDNDNDELLDECCIAMGTSIGGVVAFGAVSLTGFGDGCFSCSVIRRDRRIVAVKLN